MPRSISPLNKQKKPLPKPRPLPPVARPRPAARKPEELFRFPDGTRFFCLYNAESQKWLIQLCVPDEPPLEVHADGIHWGLRKAGRTWKEKNRGERQGGLAQDGLPRPADPNVGLAGQS